jgi:hypothetical protein
LKPTVSIVDLLLFAFKIFFYNGHVLLVLNKETAWKNYLKV